MLIGNDIELAAKLLNENKLVAIPTETVYGLAANAFSTSAVLQIYKTKNRPQFNPLIIHSNSILRFEEWGIELPNEVKELGNLFWPGPLTVVVKANNKIPNIVTAGTGAVAIRVPNHPLTLQLLANLDFPLAAPSANPSGSISPTTAAHVAKSLGNQIDYILDGGKCEVGVESTIISFLEKEAKVLRFGGLAVEKIEATLGKKMAEPDANKPNKIVAPGMLTRHYASKHTLILTEDLVSSIHAHKEKKMGVISFFKFVEGLTASNQFVLSQNADLEEAASNLFSAMQQLDDLDLDIIIAEKFPNIGLGFAINDRLKRASIQY